MTDWWEYEPADSYYKRQAEQFRSDAMQAVANRTIRDQIINKGLNPDSFDIPGTQFDQKQESKPNKSIFGLVKSFMGDVGDVVEEPFKLLGQIPGVEQATETLARGPIHKPWDVLRPVKQAMDWEQENIGAPLYKGAVTLGSTPIISALEGRSFGESYQEAQRRYEKNVPELVKTIGSGLTVPSSFVGVGEATDALKLFTRSKYLMPILGKVGFGEFLPQIKGGATETAAMAKLLNRVHLASPDFAVKGAAQTIEDAAQQNSFTQVGRQALSKLPGVNDLLTKLNPNFFDSEVGTLFSEAARIPGMGKSYSALAGDHFAQVMREDGWVLSKDGRVLSILGSPIKDAPTVNTLIAKYKGMGSLTQDQVNSIIDLNAPVRTQWGLEKAFGVKLKKADTPLGEYSARAVKEAPYGVEDVMAHASTAQARANAYAPRFGYTKKFQKARQVATQEKGMELGIQYHDWITAQQMRIESGFDAMGEQWFKTAIEPLAKQPGIMKKLDALTTPHDPNIFEKINNGIRPFMAVLDASFLGVQGLMGLARHPLMYGQSALTAFRDPAAYEELVKTAKASGLMDKFIQSGGYWAARNDMGEFALKGIAHQILDIGGKMGKFQPATVSETWFTKFGNSMRLKLFDSAVQDAETIAAKSGSQVTQQSLRDIASFANKATGYTTTKTSQIESMTMFAPKYFKAQMGLIADALTKGKMGGGEARNSLIRLVTLGAISTIGINKALGNETDFDPTSSNFLRIRAFGKDISVFGTWDTLVRGALLLGQGKVEDAAKYMARSKASPTLGTAWSVISGSTFTGGDIDFSSVQSAIESAGRLGANAMPMGLQNLASGGIPTDISDIPSFVGGGAVNLAGTKANPLTGWEQLKIRRDELAQNEFNTTWDKLEPYQITQLTAKYPNETKALEPTTDVGKSIQLRQEIATRYADMQSQLDQQFPMGQDWIDQYQNLNQRRAGEYKQWDQNHPDIVRQNLQEALKDPNKAALIEYRNSFDLATNPGTGQLDVKKLTLIQNSLEAKWTLDQKAYIERNIGQLDTPMVKQYKADQKILKPYWQIEDQVWKKLQQMPGYGNYATYDDYVNAQYRLMSSQGIPAEQISIRIAHDPATKFMSEVISNLHIQYRRQHPEAQAALARWGYVTALPKSSSGSPKPVSTKGFK